jgi:hypothetical protein
MDYIGQPFSSFGNRLATVAETRESLLVVSMSHPAVLRFEDFEYPARYVGGGIASVGVSLSLGGKDVLLVLLAGEGTQFLQLDFDRVGIVSSEDDTPVVAMYAKAPEGEVYFHLEIDLAGNLHISTEPTPASAPVTFDTGELLDTSEMTAIGSVGLGNHWTYCSPNAWPEYAGHACFALIRAGDLVPLQPGNTTCVGGDHKEVRFTGSFGVLQMRGENGTTFPCGPPGGVAPSQPLGYPGLWSAVAFAPNGSRLSVAVTHDGTVYVGEVTPKYGCPCRTGT